MFSRVVSFTGAKDIDAGIRYTEETVAPLLRQQKGFRGTTASADRAGGVYGVLSLWETEADRDASESALAKVREEAVGIIGGSMTVETFEEVLLEILAPPTVGASLLIRRLSMEPAAIEDNVAFFRAEILPQIKANAGLRAVRQMVNRTTGDAVVGTVWDDAITMRAAAEVAEARRGVAAQRGVTFGGQSQRQIVFIDLP